MTQVTEMVELSGAELDAVSGGQAGAAGGLVNLALSTEDISILNNNHINVLDNVTIRDVANNNDISVGALINILGGPSAILTRQTQ
jgi:hypothetical protein